MTKNQEQKDGFNTDLHTPKESGIVSDKRDAYMQEAMQNKQQEKMRSLQDFAFSLGEDDPREGQVKITPQAPDYYEEPGSGNKSSRNENAFRTSNNAYQDVNRQLGSFYEEPTTKVDEQAQLALESRIQELERQLTEEQERKSSEEEQLAMIEKSYAIAARYMGGGERPSDGNAVQTVANTASGKVAVQPVAQVRHNVVSLLAAPMPDSVFMEEFVKPRNWGFNTVTGNEDVKEKTVSGLVFIRR